MMKKLKLCIVLLLISTLSGWTQSSNTKWSVWKSNNDTIITYNFTKPELTNLHVYILNLEKDSKLYSLELLKSKEKDSLLSLKDTRLVYKDSIILESNKLIEYQRLEQAKLDKINADLKKAYARQKTIIPIVAGGSVLTTLLLCFLLVK